MATSFPGYLRGGVLGEEQEQLEKRLSQDLGGQRGGARGQRCLRPRVWRAQAQGHGEAQAAHAPHTCSSRPLSPWVPRRTAPTPAALHLPWAWCPIRARPRGLAWDQRGLGEACSLQQSVFRGTGLGCMGTSGTLDWAPFEVIQRDMGEGRHQISESLFPEAV